MLISFCYLIFLMEIFMGWCMTCLMSFLKCKHSNGMGIIIALPKLKTSNSLSLPIMTIEEYYPFLNFLPFGMCKNLLNPMVLAATILNWGILKPFPCLPLAFSPWQNLRPKIKIGSQKNPTDSECTKMCIWPTGKITGCLSQSSLTSW